MANDIYYIGANDEHGVNPPTLGKRTPIMPGLNRPIYENEFNRAAKVYFIEACLRNGFSVYDVKPEFYDVPINTRINRINRQNLTLLVTFAYNAYGEEFNSSSGLETFYSPLNPKASQSQRLAQNLYDSLIVGTAQTGRGVKPLDVGVLSNVNCVSSLIEAGFMTNLREARLMINPLFQVEVGEESCRGVCNYLGVTYLPREPLSNYPILKVGTRNNFVFLLQYMLVQNGYSVTVDGIFGNGTKTAVQNFQRRNGLSVDGIVGNNTWKYLLFLPPYPTLRQGSTGSYVTFLQRMLESNLIPVGTIDGSFGPKTASAVRTFQQNSGLTVDGIVGQNTWNALVKPI
ncbi:MAG: peptidoglycan-binding protein [Candidatus Caccovivens sp.]